MKKYFLFLILTFFCTVLTTFLTDGVSFAEEIPQRVDGKIISVDQTNRLLLVDFEHPATGEHMEKKFFVNENAGFKDFKKLNQLKKNDLVSVDYYDYKPIPKAVYIIRIPVEKTYFTHKEIAQALVKIKSNQKDINASKG